MFTFSEFLLKEVKVRLSRNPLPMKDKSGKLVPSTPGNYGVIINSPNPDIRAKFKEDTWPHISDEEFSTLQEGTQLSLSARFVAVNLAGNKSIIIFGNANHHVHVGLLKYLSEFVNEQGITHVLRHPGIGLDDKGQPKQQFMSSIPSDYIDYLKSNDRSQGDYMGKSYRSKSILLGFVEMIKHNDTVTVKADKTYADQLNKKFKDNNHLYNVAYANKLSMHLNSKKDSVEDSIKEGFTLAKKADIKEGETNQLLKEWSWVEEIIPRYFSDLNI